MAMSDATDSKTAQPADDRTVLVIADDADVACHNCEYPLRGIPVESVCPECGTSVTETIAELRLRALWSAPKGPKRFLIGAAWLLMPIFAFLICAMLSRSPWSAFTRPGLFLTGLIGGMVASFTLHVIVRLGTDSIRAFSILIGRPVETGAFLMSPRRHADWHRIRVRGRVRYCLRAALVAGGLAALFAVGISVNARWASAGTYAAVTIVAFLAVALIAAVIARAMWCVSEHEYRHANSLYRVHDMTVPKDR
jgi:hypothetical protein